MYMITYMLPSDFTPTEQLCACQKPMIATPGMIWEFNFNDCPDCLGTKLHPIPMSEFYGRSITNQ